MTNEELIEIQKDAITTGAGGQLSPEELDSFIEAGIDQTPVLQEEFQVMQVTASTMNIDVLEVAGRILRPGVEGTAFSTKTGVTIPRRQLLPIEVVLYNQITDKFLRRNISREQAREQINRMMSKAFMLDLFDLAINGDEDDAGADADFLNIIDGIVVTANEDDDVHDVEFGADDKIEDVLAKLIDEMPNAYAGDVDRLRIYISPVNYRKYQRELAARNTALGDTSKIGNMQLYYEGIKLVRFSKLSNDKIFHTLTKNFAVGYGLNMTVEAQRQALARATDYVTTAEVDANYAISDAVVMASKV